MKKLLYLFMAFTGLSVCLTSHVIAQGGVGIGINTPLSTLDVGGSQANAISLTAISSATVLDVNMATIIATPSSAYTITLPTLSSSARRIYTIVYNGIAGTNTITISGNGANIVSGGVSAANYFLNGGTVTMQNNGTSWYITSFSPCTGTPGSPGTITGPTSVCGNSNGNVYAVAEVMNATSYNWVLPPGATITAGQGTHTITVTMGSSSGNISVSASNACGTSIASAPLSVTLGSTIAPDATNYVAGTGASSNTFTITTSNANEIILVGVVGNGGGGFNGSVTVDGSSPSQVNAVSGTNASQVLYGYVATAAGSHTINVTWGSNWGGNGLLGGAYAASFTGFCGTPTLANVQSTTVLGTTAVSASITPAVANSCLVGVYNNFTNSAAGIVTWTNNDLIRTDRPADARWDFSLAIKQVSSTASVTVSASDNVAAGSSNWTSMILAVVHP